MSLASCGSLADLLQGCSSTRISVDHYWNQLTLRLYTSDLRLPQVRYGGAGSAARHQLGVNGLLVPRVGCHSATRQLKTLLQIRPSTSWRCSTTFGRHALGGRRLPVAASVCHHQGLTQRVPCQNSLPSPRRRPEIPSLSIRSVRVIEISEQLASEIRR